MILHRRWICSIKLTANVLREKIIIFTVVLNREDFTGQVPMAVDMFGAKQGPKSNLTSKEKYLLVKYPLILTKNEVGGSSLVNRARPNSY